MTRQIDLSKRNMKIYSCDICKKVSHERIQFAIHHISYYPEVTIFICNYCHKKIHQGLVKEYPPPPLWEASKFYRSKS